MIKSVFLFEGVGTGSVEQIEKPSLKTSNFLGKILKKCHNNELRTLSGRAPFRGKIHLQ
jgi:hypothetical protein